MVIYSNLPQRLRRVIQRYEYCVQSVLETDGTYVVNLREGYKGKDGATQVQFDRSSDIIYFFKDVIAPRRISSALYSFTCPMCQRTIVKGQNFVDLGGLQICTMCGLKDT
jgi:predicted RNA-binding Zn-ribbon protein involved in translation (DUF1610 family)